MNVSNNKLVNEWLNYKRHRKVNAIIEQYCRRKLMGVWWCDDMMITYSRLFLPDGVPRRV